MLLATTSLAARIERAEADTAAAFARRAGDSGTPILIAPVGGTHAVYGGPGQPFNKIAGLGFAPLDEEALARLEAAYDDRGAEMRVEQSSLADPSVAAMLTRRGFTLIGYENVLGLPLTAGVVTAFAAACEAAREQGIEIAAAAAAETPAWIRAAAEGFLTPDVFDGPPPTESFARESMERIFADFSGAPGCALYLARREGEIAGTGALRIVDRLAQLAGASTLPAHRRRGVQSILMRARLVAAAAAGCDLAVVTTEPGSRSQQNVQRAGFALLYVRAVLVRPPITAAADA
ncbi:MAG TPA: GNAT family N-acetyltransferase [Vicinamibacterales bacterium]|nr:GNAT family N-acetyltransferase [Vicinamibacterales bacterium]